MINVEETLMSLLTTHLRDIPLDIPVAWNFRSFDPNTPGALHASGVGQVNSLTLAALPAVQDGDVIRLSVGVMDIDVTITGGETKAQALTRLAALWPGPGTLSAQALVLTLTAPANGTTYGPEVTVLRAQTVIEYVTPTQQTKAKVANAYLIPALLNGAHTPAGCGEIAMNRAGGIYQVGVKVLGADGWGADRAIIDTIRRHFKRGKKLIRGGVTVTVESVSPAPTFDEGSGWTYTPVTIQYRMESPNK